MLSCVRVPFPVMISPMIENAIPSWVRCPTNNSFAFVKPNVGPATAWSYMWKTQLWSLQQGLHPLPKKINSFCTKLLKLPSPTVWIRSYQLCNPWFQLIEFFLVASSMHMMITFDYRTIWFLYSQNPILILIHTTHVQPTLLIEA
jgi:hypothetical protein